MNLKFESMKIDPSKPFENDLLDREDEIKNLSLLISNINSPAVLAIDSRWGTGKTTFIKLWEQYLKGEGLESLYFNAWETDFSEDPLVAFLGEINDHLKTLIGVSDRSKTAWSKAKSVGGKIVKRGIPALIRVGTAGVIDANEIVEDELSGVMSSLAGDALDDYLQQKNSIAEFHESLTELISISVDNEPIVIFVDELDRCRPTYAISLLERVKHLFNVEGIVFVLALDKIQLGHSIGAIYGDGIDSDGYLRRFIDFEYRLKIPELSAYINSLFMGLSLDEFFEPRNQYRELKNDSVYLKNVFLMLAKSFNLTLREIEQIFVSINLALRTAKENEYIYPALMVFLVMVKNVKADVYKRYVSEMVSELEIIEYLYEIVPDKGREENFECALIEGLLISAKSNLFNNEKPASLIRHENVIDAASSTHKEKQYSDYVLHVASNQKQMGSYVNLEILVKRIELVSQFKLD